MLHKKMFRDIFRNLSQFITIFLMTMIGVMVYVGIESYMAGMTQTANNFYTKNNLQDLNVLGYNFTKDDLETVRSINHVKNAERKLSLTAKTNKNHTLLVEAIETNSISKIYALEGDGFIENKRGVWLDNFYAKENNIKVGDTIYIKYNDIKINEKVIGLVNVPDHLYDVKDASELYPNREEFGFAYINITELPEVYHMFNTIMVDVDKKGNNNLVKESIEENLSNAKVIMKIEDTSSYTAYQGEIDEGKTYVGVFSGLFIFIAILSVITTMTRIVKKQRVQIGTLKALGFSNQKILFHYIGFGFWISIFASICGLFLGFEIIGKLFMNMQMDLFEVPNGKPIMIYKNYILAVIVVLIVSVITYITGRSILKENAAETLRNKIPSIKGKSLEITKKGIFKNLSFSSKWNIRDILRNKMRTITGIAGIVGCTALIVCAFGMLDSLNYFVKLQYSTLYNFDYKLNLRDNITKEQLNDLYKKYGKNTSSQLLIEIKDENGKKSNNIFITDAGNYIRFVDNKNNIKNKPSDDGIYVTYKLAKTEGYEIGDKITWHIEGDKRYYTSKIIGFNKDPQNQNISMTKNYFESLGLTYNPSVIYTNSDLSDVKEIEGVELLQDIDSLKEGMDDMLSMIKNMLILITIFACILGMVIIYNLGILSFNEKEYQFATLKVLGFDDIQIKNIFIKQNIWIGIISIIIGLPVGFYLTDYLFKVAIEEHYDFEANITLITYIIASVGTLFVTIIVSKLLARKVKKINMVTSLKGNE